MRGKITSSVAAWMTKARELCSVCCTASTTVMSVTPCFASDKAQAMPLGPAHTMRTFVSVGRDIIDRGEVGMTPHRLVPLYTDAEIVEGRGASATPNTRTVSRSGVRH